MRILLFFDLPMETVADRRAYRRFRKALIKNGFFMLQKSVYTKMLIAPSMEKPLIHAVEHYKPASGIVQVLTVTEKQFSKMRYLLGEAKHDVLDTDERVVIL